MSHLESTYGLNRFVLVGWSFGGAPVFTTAGQDSRVVGCATIASQTAETSSIRKLSPRPVLLMHGTADQTLGASCSESLFERYGGERGVDGRGKGRLVLFEGDNHSLQGNAVEAERLLLGFIVEMAGVEIDEGVVREKLVKDQERVKLMEQGGDLDGKERLE